MSPANASALNPQNINGLNLYCYCDNNPVSASYKINTARKNTITNSNIKSSNLISFTNLNSNSFSYKPLTFSIGLVTPDNSQLPNWMDFSAFYISGHLGLGEKGSYGSSLASLDIGIIYMKGEIITFDDLNGSLYLGIGALNASASLSVNPYTIIGGSASFEITSLYFGININNAVSIDGKVYCGWGIALDFSKGIKIGIGAGIGFELSINF